jgi:hypothetical protein
MGYSLQCCRLSVGGIPLSQFSSRPYLYSSLRNDFSCVLYFISAFYFNAHEVLLYRGLFCCFFSIDCERVTRLHSYEHGFSFSFHYVPSKTCKKIFEVGTRMGKPVEFPSVSIKFSLLFSKLFYCSKTAVSVLIFPIICAYIFHPLLKFRDDLYYIYWRIFVCFQWPV